jgi:hypothetical protein
MYMYIRENLLWELAQVLGLRSPFPLSTIHKLETQESQLSI